MLNILSAGLLSSVTNRNGATSTHTTAISTNILFQPFILSRTLRLGAIKPAYIRWAYINGSGKSGTTATDRN
jgi:hypothetical protein